MSEFSGITYKDKHSFDDFSAIISKRKITSGTKDDLTVRIPCRTSRIDLSSYYGKDTYDDGKLSYTFDISAQTREEIEKARLALADWLLPGTDKTWLRDDLDGPDWYYYAKCTGIDFSIDGLTATLRADFTADPYMYTRDLSRYQLWDPFCFDTDYFNRESFTFDTQERQTAVFFNPLDVDVQPWLTASSQGMLLVVNGRTFSLDPGDEVTREKRSGLVFHPGQNSLAFYGKGSVAFEAEGERIY